MQAMRCIVKTFRRPPTGRLRDRNGGLPGLSDGVAHASRCPASPQRTLLAENLGQPSLWVMIDAPWYQSIRPGCGAWPPCSPEVRPRARVWGEGAAGQIAVGRSKM